MEYITPENLSEVLDQIDVLVGGNVEENPNFNVFQDDSKFKPKWNSYQFYIGKDKKYCVSLLMDMEKNKDGNSIIVVRGISITEKGFGVYG